MEANECYDQSALRHFADAEVLAREGHFDGAGHLIGFAAECAIKHAVASVRPLSSAPHKHLPELIEAAKKTLRGTKSRPLLALFQLNGYFADWFVNGRYLQNEAVSEAKYAEWRLHASRTLGAAGLRGNANV